MRGLNVCAMWFSHGCCYENVKQFSHQIGMYIEHNHIGSHTALPTIGVIAILLSRQETTASVGY